MNSTEIDLKIYAPFFHKLKGVYGKMAVSYDAVAEHYGFDCNGCEDNCCMTRFYHHTLIEYSYILEGINGLDPHRRESVRKRALEVCRKAEVADKSGTKLREMCPLNSEGKCILYEYRPMICRLHGPHSELRRPGQDGVMTPGCGLFTEVSGGKEYAGLDRTPLYIELAGLEREVRAASGVTEKIKKTIAEMLV